MRRVVILLLILFVSSGLYGVSFDFSYWMEKNSSTDFHNYELTTEFEYNDAISAMLKYDYDNGKYAIDYITELKHNWSYGQIQLRRIMLENSKNEISVELLGRYPVSENITDLWILKILSDGYWELGFRQCWNRRDLRYVPSSKLVVGKTYRKTLDFFLIPAYFSYSVNYASSNGKRWENSTEVTAGISILAYLDCILKYVQEDDWVHFRTGIKIKI